MIGSLLIANRGEIARRIIRTARRLGIRTIAVYSSADAGAPHTREADEAVEIGPAPARDSYLRSEAVLAAARLTGARAVHPGYGFLSENATFAEAVIAQGLVWVGPPPSAIRAMGLKDAAKRLMASAGVPVTPGYLGDDQSESVLAAEAARIGWPVLIKAVAGGGGKGMRAVHAAEAFGPALASARREAASAFGDDRVLLEKLITSPRHIEVQVFADAHGGVVHLFERDCSLQRRHQKVIEEAPAPGMDARTRATLCESAVRAARAVDYEGAGTVEFIADASEGLRPDRIWFMEMNTRLQVEHPVTEAVTGIDLVEWQLRVASGEPLPLTQAEILFSGHAMEARLYAEDPAHGFLPSVGPLAHLRLPESLRVDSGFEAGGEITPFYDSMIAKLIAHAETREEAAAILANAAEAVEVWPVKTNAAFLARCVAHTDFLSGRIDTGFIEARLEGLVQRTRPSIRPWLIAELARQAALPELTPEASPWNPEHGVTGFRLNAVCSDRASFYLDGAPADGAYDFHGGARDVLVDGDGLVIFQNGSAHTVSLSRPADKAMSGDLSDGAILTPMPGRIVAISVEVGQGVLAGQTLVVLEAMKMEHALTAPAAGRVAEVLVALGDQVRENVVAVRLDPKA
jgi:acetyl/propionyl-CoA carboxylase alpha subunit